MTWFRVQRVARWREEVVEEGLGETGSLGGTHFTGSSDRLRSHISLEQSSGLLMPSVLLFDSLSRGGKSIIGQILNCISIMIGKLELLCDYMDLA